ncbi:reticulophagy regulator 3-like isoform X3 [Xenopus laevis]|uniref:Reticulophagy regulator 3-like isoform X3 n=1 Tax=Xenopus laevis TaxID=8355 RepID=A0A8J1LRB3_XENLA|nr:reticulophagy regulator 3-like isoform X3 [Xenopus laevis]
MQKMAQRVGEEERGASGLRRSGAQCVEARERDERVRDLQEMLQQSLSSYQTVLSYVQAVLVWEKPRHSALLHLGLNAAFWFFALTSLRMLFFVAFGLMIIICADQWKNKLWPELGDFCCVYVPASALSIQPSNHEVEWLEDPRNNHYKHNLQPINPV